MDRARWERERQGEKIGPPSDRERERPRPQPPI